MMQGFSQAHRLSSLPLTNRLYPYCQVMAARQLTGFSSVYRHGVTRDPLCQGYRVAPLYGYFAAGGAIVDTGGEFTNKHNSGSVGA